MIVSTPFTFPKVVVLRACLTQMSTTVGTGFFRNGFTSVAEVDATVCTGFDHSTRVARNSVAQLTSFFHFDTYQTVCLSARSAHVITPAVVATNFVLARFTIVRNVFVPTRVAKRLVADLAFVHVGAFFARTFIAHRTIHILLHIITIQALSFATNIALFLRFAFRTAQSLSTFAVQNAPVSAEVAQ